MTAKALACFFLVALGAAALAGCPLASDHPLGSPAEARLDSALTGTWKTRDADTGLWVTMELLPYNDREYVAWSRDPDPGSQGKTILYRIFVTVIDGQPFLNIQELGTGAEAMWSYAGYTVSGDALSLRFIDDELFSQRSFGSSDALQDFVRTHLKDPRLYVSDEGKASVMSWQRVPR